VALLSLIKHKPIDVMEKDRADRQTDRQRHQTVVLCFQPGTKRALFTKTNLLVYQLSFASIDALLINLHIQLRRVDAFTLFYLYLEINCNIRILEKTTYQTNALQWCVVYSYTFNC